MACTLLDRRITGSNKSIAVARYDTSTASSADAGKSFTPAAMDATVPTSTLLK
jgi:hypothetical protein